MKKELLSVYRNSNHKISSEINLYAITRAKIKYLVHICSYWSGVENYHF